ncbi:NAD(P)H-dependent flavin oxidoreductase [Ottowia sp. VDI28]|uniref:NAD(P)H-dependent flavin oxidoreductase n=1 Tax=Ottowia sp. VDI28 TaxID=3133968 RepID=UPI003C2F7787
MIATALTRLFNLKHPIVLGPMGGVSGGALAAAVSNAGGLGLVGGGYGDPDWLRAELAIVRRSTTAPWGAGVITWAVGPEVVQQILAEQPQAVMLSFGDPRPHGALVKAAGCKLICQVQDLASALLAREAGADLIVAQGTEAGGHGSTRSTLALVPAVVDAVGPVPVLAAGGIADGRGLAAALMLGAQGALIGTRFYASHEALGSSRAKASIANGSGEETERTTVFDIVRGFSWPKPYTGRALRNQFMAQWQGQEPALADAVPTESRRFKLAQQDEDFETAMVWAGEAIDLIKSVEPAGEIVQRISADAERILSAGAAMCQSTS